MQAAAVAAGRVRLHRQLGGAAMLYGAIVFGVGLLVGIGAPALRVRDGQFPLDVGGIVVLYNLADMLLFGVFLALAFAYRKSGALLVALFFREPLFAAAFWRDVGRVLLRPFV